MTPPSDADILEERARALASRQQSEQRHVAVEGAVVEAGGERFLLPTGALEEIRALPAITPVPVPLPALRGVAYVGGEVITVFDLARLLDAHERTESPFVAVVRGASGCIGFTVTAVLGYRTLYQDELVDAPSRGKRPITAITRDLIGWIDVDRLLELSEVSAR